MNNLTSRTAALLAYGAKTTGTFLEGYYMIEEELYTHEAKDIFAFCRWIDTEVGGATETRLKWLYAAYKNPDNAQLKARLDEYKSLLQNFRNNILNT